MGKRDLKAAQDRWLEGPYREGLRGRGERKKAFATQSGLPIKPVYTPLDLEDIGFDYREDLGFPGQYPFTRGKDATGYRDNFWIFQQYAGFGDAEEANKRYRFLLEKGQTGVSIALDLPTQIGIDSDHPLAEGEVGKVGVAIDSLEDLEILFSGIPLNKPRQISLVANSVALIGLAMFIALAEKQKVSTQDTILRIQNDVLKEFIARGTYMCPPGPSLRMATDVVTYCAENHPNWLPMTICGYHIRESGSTAIQEIAFSLANAMEYMDHVHRKGFAMEKVLPKLSAFMSVNMDFFEEVAKFRALRRLWSTLFAQRYAIQDLSVLNFNLVNFTAGSSLTAQQPMNNIVRVTIECLAGVLGGCQSLFPCSMDEAYCTPSEQAVNVALRTQQIIAHETGVADTIDPLGGSYYVESLTKGIETEVIRYLAEVEQRGGSVKAIEQNYFQEEIAEASYRLQNEIENRERVIVGVNEYREKEETPIEVFKPPRDTAEKQHSKLKRIRENRNNSKVKGLLKEIERVAEGEDNLVPILVEAVKNYATLGEICDVFRKVYGGYEETAF
ncbi:MAG: methylmalonyl-CoA mutase [Desulfomonile tiedjei]|nr:methylmalonyl-CoA mutase [Desulfomonile tiedjei]